jgi:hypothetical protein
MTAVGRMALALGLACTVWAWRSPVAFQVSNQAATASQSPGPVTFTLRLAGSRHQFRPGEIIPIELTFDSAVPKRFVVDGATYGRIGFWIKDEFLLEPLDTVTDPMIDYLASRGATAGSLAGSGGVLGDKPYTVTLYLNEWFRFDKPGAYTLSIRSNRVTDEAGPEAGAAVPLESNSVSFEVLPRDARLEAEALIAALATLDSGASDPVPTRDACRTLRVLGTDAAVDEMIARYGSDSRSGCETEYTIGLLEAPNRPRTLRQLEAGLHAPGQPITQTYLRTLAILSIYEQHPEFRPAQTRDTKGRMPQSGELGGRQDLIDAAVAAYADLLTAALPEKTDRARAMTIAAQPQLLERGPSSAAAVDLAANFLDLPADRQRSLLESQWQSVVSPAMIPALRQLAAAPAAPPPSLADLALRRLYQLSPEEGRPLILREVANPRSGATLTTLGILPEAELPDLDDTLAVNLDSSSRLEDLNIRAELVERYASAAIAPRVRAYLERRLGQLACRPQTALLAYMLRIDQALGETLLNRALNVRQTTGCYRFVLEDVAALRITPGVVAAAIVHLDDADTQTAISAINTLARDGSPASQARLRERFERWHQTWQGRAAELRFNATEIHTGPAESVIESSLLRVLGPERVATISRPEAEELRALCVTDSCRTTADQLLKTVGRRGMPASPDPGP